MSDFVHIILYEEDFVGRVNSKDLRTMWIKELIEMKDGCIFS